MARLEELFLTYFLAVLCFHLARSSRKEEDVIAPCSSSAFCVLDPPGCQSMDDCNLAAIFTTGGTPNQISVKLRVRDPTPDPYVLLRFSEKPLQDIITNIYCSPGKNPIRFSFGSSGNRYAEFAKEKTNRMLAKVENVAVVNNVLKCDFTRTVTAGETEIEANSVLKEQSVALITGSKDKNGEYGVPHLSIVSEHPVDLKASLQIDLLTKINENIASGPHLSLNGGNSRKGKAFRKLADAGATEDERVGNSDDDDDDDGNGIGDEHVQGIGDEPVQGIGDENVGRKAAAVGGSNMGKLSSGGPVILLMFMLGIHAMIRRLMPCL